MQGKIVEKTRGSVRINKFFVKQFWLEWTFSVGRWVRNEDESWFPLLSSSFLFILEYRRPVEYQEKHNEQILINQSLYYVQFWDWRVVPILVERL